MPVSWRWNDLLVGPRRHTFCGANAIIYAAKGDYANAALSAAAMIPIGGQAAAGLKLGLKGLNAADRDQHTSMHWSSAKPSQTPSDCGYRNGRPDAHC